MALERKTAVEYPDGTYEIIQDKMRANSLLVSNISQHGLSGMGASKRTAFFTFFGRNLSITILHAYTDDVSCLPLTNPRYCTSVTLMVARQDVYEFKPYKQQGAHFAFHFDSTAY
jgi:hypothetical protein